jgi:antitoxin component of MazEF toxin-antitoxin module
MSTLTKLRNRAQVTLPKEVVKALDLQVGDDLKVEVKSGCVVITPVAVIPKDELWAWKPEIHEAILEGRKEARTGKLKSYDNLDEMFAEWEDEGGVVVGKALGAGDAKDTANHPV